MSQKELWQSMMLLIELEHQRHEKLAKVRAELAEIGRSQEPKHDLLRVQLYAR